ncbi:MAG: PKD domain-containing protein [Bacteroidales bacterium]|nr:PKD domain-containing protein [Bacteroidales bacterium]
MKNVYFLVVVLFLLSFQSFGQISQGGEPPSFQRTLLSDNIETINLSAPDVEKLLLEDLENDKNGQPQRIAVNVAVFVNPQNSGTWQDIENGRIWRLKIHCEGALGMNVQFEKFHLPEGSQLFLYNEDKTQVIGAFTSFNNHESGLFATELIEGDLVTLEYFDPKGTNEYAEIGISNIAYAYRNVSFLFKNTDEFGDSDWCEVNVNCSPEGNNWQDEKRGVARTLTKIGSTWYWCTGSLVNNTSENGVPYYLLADHCGGSASVSDMTQWVFYFNYESSGCSNPGSSPAYNSLTGAAKKARGNYSGGSDFLLMQLNSTPPLYYYVYYNGWDRSGSSSSSGVSIHHPSGDIKKISTYTLSLTTATWSGGASSAHWRVYWSSTTNGHGVTEGGSSGSPIFNSAGRILGTLTGGASYCSTPNSPDYYGKFSYHWQSNGSTSATQLKPWLDPTNTGVTYLDGWDPNANIPPVANFQADNTAPGIGQTVNFTDLSSEDPTSWSWSFNPSTVTYVGGTSSSSQNPQVQFNNLGYYSVTLVAGNAYGSDSETKNNYINVSYYCGASGASTYLEIVRVELGDIDNSSGQNFYSDYTYLSTDLAKDQPYDITIDVDDNDVYQPADLGIWIDWNQDGIFNDTDEQVVCEPDNYGEGTFNFTVPGTATPGQTRMRVRTKYNLSNCGDPCGTSAYGEVEDYSVNIVLGVDPPVADFEADNTNPGVGATVMFTDLSTNNPDTWSWGFNPATVTYVGGTNSSDPNPQVQFDNPGLYMVELFVSNAGGNDTEVKTDYIDVIYPPLADFEADNLNPGIGQAVNFTDLSSNNPDDWFWSFLPSTVTFVGGTGATDQNPQVQFDAGGLYTVELIVSNPSGDDSEIKTSYIDVVFAPIANFDANNLYPGIGEPVTFTDLSLNNPDTWSWSFTPPTITYTGGTGSSDPNPQVQFDAGGLYTVELTVSNISGNDTETKIAYIDVVYAPVANFEADNLSPVIGETVNFIDLSDPVPNAWLWNFSPPTVTFVGGSSASDPDPQVQFNTEGLYTVELLVTNISGYDSEIKTDYINVLIPVIELDIKVNMEGPFNGTNMNAQLIPFMPLVQPYNVSPWYYPGLETVFSVPGSDIVDWILVEIRDALSTPDADGSSTIGMQAAFLRNDGQVVNLMGNPMISFETALQYGLYIVVHHRNHLSILSSVSVPESGGIYSYDFTTDPAQAYQDGQNTLTGGAAGMVGGNGFADDKEVNLLDKMGMWDSEAGKKGYYQADYNLDSRVDNLDKNDNWFPNRGIGSQVPE